MTDRNPEEVPGEFEPDELPEDRAQFTQPVLPPENLPEEPFFPHDEDTQTDMRPLTSAEIAALNDTQENPVVEPPPTVITETMRPVSRTLR